MRRGLGLDRLGMLLLVTVIGHRRMSFAIATDDCTYNPQFHSIAQAITTRAITECYLMPAGTDQDASSNNFITIAEFAVKNSPGTLTNALSSFKAQNVNLVEMKGQCSHEDSPVFTLHFSLHGHPADTDVSPTKCTATRHCSDDCCFLH